MARKILESNQEYQDGDIFRAIIWNVPKSKDFPLGVKYAFCYIHQGRRVLGYDNERKKGHHMHLIDLETNKEIQKPIQVEDIEKLLQQFKEQVEEIRKKLKDESQKN